MDRDTQKDARNILKNARQIGLPVDPAWREVGSLASALEQLPWSPGAPLFLVERARGIVPGNLKYDLPLPEATVTAMIEQAAEARAQAAQEELEATATEEELAEAKRISKAWDRGCATELRRLERKKTKEHERLCRRVERRAATAARRAARLANKEARRAYRVEQSAERQAEWGWVEILCPEQPKWLESVVKRAYAYSAFRPTMWEGWVNDPRALAVYILTLPRSGGVLRLIDRAAGYVPGNLEFR